MLAQKKSSVKNIRGPKKKEGYREGRPKRVLNDRYRHALELMETNSMREVEKKTNISLSTLKRIKKQYKEELIKNSSE